jgi:hypothetical protein
MTEFTRELMYGKRPIRRTNPKPGQSEWYYLDPCGTDRFADMKEIDVESENSPNPYANEIQNYLYNNDEYNYKQLYGNTPPPSVQTPNTTQQLQMPAGTQQQITMPSNNLQKYNNNFANFVSTTYDNVNNAYNSVKQDYFGQRNYQNRYKQGCTPSNIAYNTISNYQISPNQKLVENGNIVSNYGMKKFLSKIPIAGKYINSIATGEKIGNGLTNFYNAMDEADCFK